MARRLGAPASCCVNAAATDHGPARSAGPPAGIARAAGETPRREAAAGSGSDQRCRRTSSRARFRGVVTRASAVVGPHGVGSFAALGRDAGQRPALRGAGHFHARRGAQQDAAHGGFSRWGSLTGTRPGGPQPPTAPGPDGEAGGFALPLHEQVRTRPPEAGGAGQRPALQAVPVVGRGCICAATGSRESCRRLLTQPDSLGSVRLHRPDSSP